MLIDIWLTCSNNKFGSYDKRVQLENRSSNQLSFYYFLDTVPSSSTDQYYCKNKCHSFVELHISYDYAGYRWRYRGKLGPKMCNARNVIICTES